MKPGVHQGQRGPGCPRPCDEGGREAPPRPHCLHPPAEPPLPPSLPPARTTHAAARPAPRSTSRPAGRGASPVPRAVAMATPGGAQAAPEKARPGVPRVGARRLPRRPLNPRRANVRGPLPTRPASRRGDLLVRRHVLQHLELGGRALASAAAASPGGLRCPRRAAQHTPGRGGPKARRAARAAESSLSRRRLGAPARGEKMAAASAEAGRRFQTPGRPRRPSSCGARRARTRSRLRPGWRRMKKKCF